MMLNAWDDSGDATHSLFLEDDISVSPLYYLYSLKCINLFLSERRISNVIGCSLYTPRLDEISWTDDPQHPPLWNPSDSVGEGDLWVYYQLPCSWGAIYEKNEWMKFIAFLRHRIKAQARIPEIPNSRSNQWEQSWKR